MFALTACSPFLLVRPFGGAVVQYESVHIHAGEGDVPGTVLAVEIDLRVETALPLVAPHIVVDATCGDAHDSVDAFFMSLSNAQAGDRRSERVDLFRLRAYAELPAVCDVVLSLSEGDADPQRFCYANGTTRPGRCS